MLFKMSTEKSTTNETPAAVVITEMSSGADTTRKRCVSKKAVAVTVASFAIVGLLVTGALVGIRLYFDGRIQEITYSVKVNDVTQNVSTSDNVVTYSVQWGEVKAWIVQDFDKELQTIKLQQDNVVGCLVTALNRTLATTPESIPSWASSANQVNKTEQAESISYTIISHAIGDITFLGPKASSLCQNLPTYHAVQSCDKAESTKHLGIDRQKRSGGITVTVTLGPVTVKITVRW